MVTQKQDMADVFSIFHDGSIEEYKVEKESIFLKIYCQYLAKNINPFYEFFWVKLNQLNSISLLPWLKNSQEELFWTNIDLIFEKELEILNAKITLEDTIQVFCDCSNIFEENEVNYVGATLEFDCYSILIFDENKQEINLDYLKKIAAKYWKEFSE